MSLKRRLKRIRKKGRGDDLQVVIRRHGKVTAVLSPKSPAGLVLLCQSRIEQFSREYAELQRARAAHEKRHGNLDGWDDRERQEVVGRLVRVYEMQEEWLGVCAGMSLAEEVSAVLAGFDVEEVRAKRWALMEAEGLR